MLNFGSKCVPLAAVLAFGMTVTAAPAAAQSIAAETPGTALSRYIRVLASSPRDFNALIGAGRAALELGDVQAASGFFGRAEEVNPNAPAAKIGLGAAMAHMGDADGAIFYFNQATRLGAQPMTMAVDRGMARDLLGDLSGAQADYRLAITSLGSDEARRRLALSLAIGRDKKAALDTIQPLLNRRDPAAQRTRAFVLALVGDQAGAAQAINAVLPGDAARFEPFFRYLPSLSVTEKAAAVHLGIFPENAAARVAQVQPAPQPPAVAVRPAQPPVKIAAAEPPPRVAAPAPAFSLPSTKSGAASPSFSLPSATSAAPTASIQAPVQAKPEPVPAATDEPITEVKVEEFEPAPALAEAQGQMTEVKAETLDPAPALAETEEVLAESNLTGIDKLLATIAEPPPAPEPKVETKKPVPVATKAAKAAAAKKAAEKKARDDKLAAEKKAKEEAARLGVKGTYWVQLAGGSNQDRMAVEYRKLSAKAGKLLKSRPGYVTEGKEYFRLLVGPFDNKAASQAFVNKLAKEGVDGFSWTRTPPKIKIEKLSSS
jgi:Flp pilus assembly protein TadD